MSDIPKWRDDSSYELRSRRRSSQLFATTVDSLDLGVLTEDIIQETPEEKTLGRRILGQLWRQVIPLTCLALLFLVLFIVGAGTAFVLTNATFAILEEEAPQLSIYLKDVSQKMLAMNESAVVLNVQVNLRTFVPSLVPIPSTHNEDLLLLFTPVTPGVSTSTLASAGLPKGSLDNVKTSGLSAALALMSKKGMQAVKEAKPTIPTDSNVEVMSSGGRGSYALQGGLVMRHSDQPRPRDRSKIVARWRDGESWRTHKFDQDGSIAVLKGRWSIEQKRSEQRTWRPPQQRLVDQHLYNETTLRVPGSIELSIPAGTSSSKVSKAMTEILVSQSEVAGKAMLNDITVEFDVSDAIKSFNDPLPGWVPRGVRNAGPLGVYARIRDDKVIASIKNDCGTWGVARFSVVFRNISACVKCSWLFPELEYEHALLVPCELSDF